MARVLKKEFDAAYGGVWHCIVGRNFGSVVTHTSRTFIYIYIGHVAVLMFKAGSQAL
jgi:dynein light chain LC8-type